MNHLTVTIGDLAKDLMENGAVRIGPWVLCVESRNKFKMTHSFSNGALIFSNLYDALIAMSDLLITVND